MTRARALILCLAAWLLPVAAQAADPRLVPDVSSRNIDIQYSFTGEELLLFGAILYPGQRLPDDRADIVVVRDAHWAIVTALPWVSMCGA